MEAGHATGATLRIDRRKRRFGGVAVRGVAPATGPEGAARRPSGEIGHRARNGGDTPPPGHRFRAGPRAAPPYRDGQAGPAGRRAGASSTIRPAYITATREQVSATTPRS